MTLLQLQADTIAIPVADDRTQLRVPDGQHLTFDHAADGLLKAFALLRGGARREEIEGLLGVELADELLELLLSRGLLDPGDRARSQFRRLLDQHLALGGRLIDDSPPQSLELVGSGRIATLLAGVLEQGKASGAVFEKATSLMVVAADTDDLDALLEHNARAMADRRPVTFVRWSQRRLLVGPFVVPGQTACLDCAAHRQRAASLHVDELLAWRRSASEHPRYEGGEVLDPFVTAVALRHVHSIMAGANAIAAPGSIAMIDPISLDIVTIPVLRLPRCPTCRPSSDRPLRSVRDLN